MRPFLPAPRQTNWLILLGFSTLAGAIYVRQMILESETLAAACMTGVPLAACGLRRFILELSELGAFGGLALVLSALHFRQPHIAWFASALFATVVGLMWGNPVASSFAAAVLMITFARPRASSRTRAPTAPPTTTRPANSRTIH